MPGTISKTAFLNKLHPLIKYTNMKKTRKNYESYLNEIYPYYEPFMEYLCTKSRKVRNVLDRAAYGSILRKYDQIAFNVGFNEWQP